MLAGYGIKGEDLVLEFKKATNMQSFDQEWGAEITRISNDHYAILGAIIEFSKPGQHFLELDPMSVEAATPVDYKWSL